MITKIQDSLPPGYRDRVTKRAAERGIADVWSDALDRAKAELGDSAAESDIIRRAAIRAQQRVGVLPRLSEPPIISPAAPAEAPAAVSDGPAQNTVSDGPVQAATEEPAAKPRKTKPQD